MMIKERQWIDADTKPRLPLEFVEVMFYSGRIKRGWVPNFNWDKVDCYRIPHLNK